jgi:hypothetical protein
MEHCLDSRLYSGTNLEVCLEEIGTVDQIRDGGMIWKVEIGT